MFHGLKFKHSSNSVNCRQNVFLSSFYWKGVLIDTYISQYQDLQCMSMWLHLFLSFLCYPFLDRFLKVYQNDHHILYQLFTIISLHFKLLTCLFFTFNPHTKNNTFHLKGAISKDKHIVLHSPFPILVTSKIRYI